MNIGNSVVLNTLGVPVINSFEHLCEQLSITEQLLYYLTYKKEYCYFQKVIPKKDKTERILNVPNLSLKVVQKWILKEILEKIFVSEQTSVYKGYKQDKIEMRGDRAEMSDFPLYLNTVVGGLDRRDQTIGGFSFVVKIYAVPVVEIIGQLLYLLGRYGFNAQFSDCL